MRTMGLLRADAVAGVLFFLMFPVAATAQCAGDCSGDGEVTVDEIVTGIGIALGNAGVDVCPAFDFTGDDQVTVDEIVTSVNNALNGCRNICRDCEDGDACTTDTCEGGICGHEPVTCTDDGNECSAELCDPTSGCGHSNVPDDTPCDGGAGACLNGACVAFDCDDASDCDDGNACTLNSCVDHACNQQAVVCEDDGLECTAEVCVPESGCGHANVTDGTDCNNGAGSCRSGVCESAGTIQYQQDFEGLSSSNATALATDKWLVFGNVFDGTTGRYLYGYGTYPAPNGGPAFSAVDSGQGGPEQGEHQLSVYNDYNNMDHSKGHRIEANVFRERRLTAEDVGTTITFSFDAKRGNINNPADPLCPCSSTAVAFLKTLNPAAGYATTNLVQQNTTLLPTTWERYSLSLAIPAGLVNQLLQVGFSSTAGHFQPSGVYYDNVVIRSAPTP